MKHWFDRLKKKFGAGEDDNADLGARLKGDDLLYHEVFVIAKVSPIRLYTISIMVTPNSGLGSHECCHLVSVSRSYSMFVESGY